ncbi:MAG TPA: LuxR C-terminal-related transcriptional regulator [Gemmatimonadaceae bacterium]|nr:LuxR C-terminal-related transcriptional regulator [Gemmatimonadaceae bacterium]
MTRIAVVAASEELRTRLVAALSSDPAFDVVAVSATLADVGSSAEVVLVAREADDPAPGAEDDASDIEQSVSLTNREREILALLADGFGNKQIATRLGISPNTVKTHLELLFEKIGVRSRAEAVAVGVRRGMLLL